MISHQIRSKIQQAIEHESRTGELASQLRDTMATSSAGTVNDGIVEKGVRLVSEYIEHVPVMLEQTGATAAQMKELDNVAPLLQWAAGYFLNPTDYIPDEHGLYGLLDDAYLTLRLLEVLNNVYTHECGMMLVGTDLSRPNQAIRNFMRHGLAARLDQHVVNAVNKSSYRARLKNLAKRSYNATRNGAASIWGASFEDQTARYFAENGVSCEDGTHYVDPNGVRLY